MSIVVRATPFAAIDKQHGQPETIIWHRLRHSTGRRGAGSSTCVHGMCASFVVKLREDMAGRTWLLYLVVERSGAERAALLSNKGFHLPIEVGGSDDEVERYVVLSSVSGPILSVRNPMASRPRQCVSAKRTRQKHTTERTPLRDGGRTRRLHAKAPGRKVVSSGRERMARCDRRGPRSIWQARVVVCAEEK